jgi:hypothetical protein
VPDLNLGVGLGVRERAEEARELLYFKVETAVKMSWRYAGSRLEGVSVSVAFG